MTIPELLTYIFENYFGHLLIAIAVVLAALVFTRFEENLIKIQKLLENQPKSAEPDVPSPVYKLGEKEREKTLAPTPATPTLTVKETLEKMTRKEERMKTHEKT